MTPPTSTFTDDRRIDLPRVDRRDTERTIELQGVCHHGWRWLLVFPMSALNELPGIHSPYYCNHP